MSTIIRAFILITTLSLLCITKSDAAYDDSSSLIHFTIADGLPSNHVYCGLTDKLGNVWLGTDKGVVKYDGYNFRVFTTEDGLPNNDVWRLWQDSLDRIWIYSISSSFGYIKNDKFKSINITLGNDVFRVIDEGVVGDKTCFIGNGIGNVFFVVDKRDSVVYHKTHIDTSYVGMSEDTVVYQRSLKDKYSIYKLVFNGERLVYKEKFSDTAILKTVYSSSSNIFKNRQVAYAYSDVPGMLKVYNILTKEYKSTSIVDYGGDVDEYIYVKVFHPYNISLITNKAVYEFYDDDFSVIKKIPYRKVLPTSAQLTFYMNDSYGNNWYMTDEDGVWIKPKTPNVFKSRNKVKVLDNSVCVGGNKYGGSYWFCNSANELLVLNRDGTVSSIIKTDKKVLKVKPYNDSVLIVSSYMSFDIYNLYTHEWKSFLKLFKYNIDLNLNDINGQSIDTLFKYIISNKDGWEWEDENTFIAYGAVGINMIEVSKDSILNRTIANGKYYGMVKDTMNGKYWFHNQSSLSVYDVHTNQFKSYGNAILDVLGVSGISKILQDRFGNFYILSDKYIIQYYSGDNSLSYKMLDVDLRGAMMTLGKDKLCVAGSFGFAYCDIYGPNKTGRFKLSPNAKSLRYSEATSLFVNDTIGVLSTDKGTFKFILKDIDTSDALVIGESLPFINVGLKIPSLSLLHHFDTLRLEQNVPSLNVNMINMFGKGATKVRYKIEGYSEWQEVKSGDIIIAGLKVNKYYTIHCQVSDDVWSSGVYTFTVYRLPNWWQTKAWIVTFWVGGILALILLILLVIYITRNIVARKNEKRQQLTDLELRAIYSQINPHFIFNTLSTALFFIDKKDFDQAYGHISKFSRLLRSYLKSSQERYVSVSEEIKMLKNYIELQQIRFEDKFDYKIEVDNRIAVDSIQIPSLLLQPLVENAINHGLFHKQEKGLLSIRFKQENQNELVCEIEDSGVGRAKAEEIKNESSTKKESYGTKLTQSLIAIFKEYEKMNINLEYIDKSGDDTGTIVKLTIKNLKYVTGA